MAKSPTDIGGSINKIRQPKLDKPVFYSQNSGTGHADRLQRMPLLFTQFTFFNILIYYRQNRT